MVSALTKVVDEVVFTRVDVERSADPRRLADQVTENIPHQVIDNSRVALKSLLDAAQPDDIIIVAGSLYLLGEVRPMLQEAAQTRPATVNSSNSV